jgi:N-acetylglucosaminyl-diphospho-decaprenol L-rhamnosyltransferase
MQPPGPLDPHGDVSVVIVTYRTPEVLAECLASFERHRPRRVSEAIVIDNSADDTESPAPAFPWIRYVRNAENVHFRRGVNQGAKLAHGPYLMLLNPDTKLTAADSIARLAAVLDERPEVGLVGPRIVAEDGSSSLQGVRSMGLLDLVGSKLFLDVAWPTNPINRRRTRPATDLSGDVDTLSAAALLCRRDDFLAVGGFDERVLIYWEEQELARKLQRRGLRGFYVSEATVEHSWGEGGTGLHPPAAHRRDYERSMRLYFAENFGWRGRLTYDALTPLQVAGGALVGIVRRLYRVPSAFSHTDGTSERR